MPAIENFARRARSYNKIKMHGVKNSIENKLTDMLRSGLRELGEDPDTHPCEQYLAYIHLLSHWNRAYNLTAVHSREEMVTRHILDSLAVMSCVKGRYCLDVGTGAGLPGFPLALAGPDVHWYLLDSNMKKIRFLNHVVMQLHPLNVEVVHSRIEDYRPRHRFDTIIARAYASLKNFHNHASGLLHKRGRLVAMKGRSPERELAELKDHNISFEILEINVPLVNIIRHVVVMGT